MLYERKYTLTSDNIREWTGLEFAKWRTEKNGERKKQKKMVVKSFVVPQRPSRLRD